MSIKRTALITGATGGIGEALCHEFARHSHDLVITARNKQRLDELAARLENMYGAHVKAVAVDLNQSDAAKTLFHELRDTSVTIDIFVNNAGFGYGGYFVHNRPKTQEAMLRVNVFTPTKLCRMFLPGMLNRGYGKILNVSSTGAFVGGPYNSVYCASKAYILSLSEALSCELCNSGVTVSVLCPGATHTGFAHRANMETARLFNYGVMRPRQVAFDAYRGLMSGERLIIPGCLNKMIVAAIKFAPRCAAAKVSGFIQKQFTCL